MSSCTRFTSKLSRNKPPTERPRIWRISGTISVMNDELQQQLDSLARDECYRVDAVLKNGQLERTERVFFVGQNGSEQGPYIR